jgi:hypothetical protein
MSEEYKIKYQGMNDPEKLCALRSLVLGTKNNLFNRQDVADELYYILSSFDEDSKTQKEAWFYINNLGRMKNKLTYMVN